jgi:hypothetical protein
MEKKSQAMKQQYDKTALPEESPPLLPGQSVHVYDKLSETWKPGKVIEQLDYPPRSYIIADTKKRVRVCDCGETSTRSMMYQMWPTLWNSNSSGM